MYGLSRQELKFALLISSSHFTQHAFYRILPPLIPILSVALAYPLWQLGLLITLYSLGMGLVQAPLGILSDRIDRRFLLPTGLTLTGLAYILFAYAPVLGTHFPAIDLLGYTFEGGFLLMSLAMVIVGIGLAVVHPTGYPMITDNVSQTNKGKVLGAFGASSKLGDAATPAIIAALILLFSWEQIIILFGVIGALYGVGLYVILRGQTYETIPSGQRNQTEEQPQDGILDKDRRSYLYPMTAIYFFFVTSGLTSRGLTTFLPTFLVAVYAYSVEFMGLTIGSESIANVYFAILLVAGAVMQLYLGGLADSLDPRLILLGCMGLATAGMVMLAVFDLHPLLLLIVIIILGTGLYGVNPARDALISDLSPAEREGRTFGYIFTAATLTGAALPTVIGYLIDVAGMRRGFLLLSGGTILAALCIGLLYSERVYLSEPNIESRPEAGN